ncbi:unnamed protein product [Peniophora sp. CBMAI 1063]|nr:unnamed protein product [Peniophora sp. CBMAI 1063]
MATRNARTRKSTQRKPYEVKKPKESRDPSASAPIPACPVPSDQRPLRYWQTLIAKKLNPTIDPRDDFDIVFAATKPWAGTESEFRAMVDEERIEDALSYCPDDIEAGREKSERLMRASYDALSCPPIGHKPGFFTPNELGEPEEDVRLQSIPDSQYSIRLHGTGLSSHKAFTLDIIYTSTGQAVNSVTAGIELWGSVNPDNPHALVFKEKLRPLELIFGIKDRDINPGQENFMVTEGSACVLKRSGKRDVYFTIPERTPRMEAHERGMEPLRYA